MSLETNIDEGGDTLERMARKDQEFPALINASTICSSISVFSSLLIIISYLYLKAYHSNKANRVSLRCVFLASIMNLLNSTLDIITLHRFSGTFLCKASTPITMFSRTMGATFLTLVGINLVLVFVYNVSYTTKQLERIYYTCAGLFGLIIIVVPILDQLKWHDDHGYSDEYRCYYYIYYHQLFDKNNLLWIWYYSMLFLCVLVDAICSTIASLKLLREHQLLTRKFTNASVFNVTSDSEIQEYIRKQSSIFRKVVSRCVLYPLVPLISNVWGFVNQLALLDYNITHSVGFSLAMLDNVFSSLQGFFTAIVFFSDPGMVEIIVSEFKAIKKQILQMQGPIRLSVSTRHPLLDNSRNNSFSPSFVEKSCEESIIESVGTDITIRSTSFQSSIQSSQTSQRDRTTLRPPTPVYSPRQIRRGSSPFTLHTDPESEIGLKNG